MNRPPIQAKMSDRWPKWEAKTRDVSAAILVSPCLVGTHHEHSQSVCHGSKVGSCNSPDSRPTTFQELSRMRPRNVTFIQSGWAISHARRLVSSKPEASESQASTHMYNCRRARFGSVWGSCVGHPPASSSGHFALASRWSLGGPFAVYPNKVTVKP